MGCVMSDNWSSNEVVKTFASEIMEWKLEQGLGRFKCARKLSELTGRHCTPGVMQIVLQRLGLNNYSHTKRIEIADETDIAEEVPIEELIKSRVKASKKKRNKSKSKHNKLLFLPPEPTGIVIFGDPHVDNEGCDWGTLFSHIKIIQETEGVLAACVGDMQDNWVGRLARCYADSSVTASDGWRLSEWFLSSMQWIAIVGGNHDAWAHGPGVDPMHWLTEKCGVPCYAQDEIRINLGWKDRPDLESVIWVLRHDFSGRSWYHPTHGPHKEAMLDGKCHILTAGHIHQWGVLTTEQRHERVTHAIRVRGYKRADAYAKQKGFSEQTFGEACIVVIDPEKTGPGRITVHWDIQEGCNYLTYLRTR